jgi:hypothetical protein
MQFRQLSEEQPKLPAMERAQHSPDEAVPQSVSPIEAPSIKPDCDELADKEHRIPLMRGVDQDGQRARAQPQGIQDLFRSFLREGFGARPEGEPDAAQLEQGTQKKEKSWPLKHKSSLTTQSNEVKY